MASPRLAGAPARAAEAEPWPGQPWTWPAVDPGYHMAFPRDFGAHPDYRTEWWYLTAWLDGWGFQLTFFRSRTVHPVENPSRFAPTGLLFAHAALMLPEHAHPLHDERSARLGHPGTRASTEDTDVAIGAWSLRRDERDVYRAQVRCRHFDADLAFDPRGAAPWLQGEAGFSRKGAAPGQASHYYSRPQLHVSGELRIVASPASDARPGTRSRRQTRAAPVVRRVQGRAWFDHEWSTTLLDPSASGWDWVGLNLDDGSAFVAFRIRRRADDAALWQYAARREPDGRARILPTVRFTPLEIWQSPRTRARWPVSMQIDADGRRWRLVPLFPDQELDSRASTGNVYWEGAVTVLEGGRRIGAGYLELTGYHETLRL